MRNLTFIARVAVGAIGSLLVAQAAANDCPKVAESKGSFVVERGADSRTELFYGNGALVQSVLRYRDRTLLETTLYEGIFELERLDRGRRYTLKPKSNLAKFFPLKPKQKIEVGFDIQQGDGKPMASLVKLTVIGADSLTIGSCRYDILKLQRDETGARLFNNVDYYAPALKLIVAKEYKERDGRMTLIKFDKIYAVAR